MTRQLLIIVILLAVLAGSLVTVGATLRDRDETLRGYVDPARDANLPYRVPFLGVNAELTQYSPDELSSQLELMRQAHITWVRQFFLWEQLEPQPGVFRWETYDAIIEAFASQSQLELVAVLVSAPSWAVSHADADTAPSSPASPEAFAAFARAFAERYGTTIDYYQVWDEPNLAAGWGASEPRPAAYLALLQAAHTAIHEADSGATVIAAALAPTTETGPDNLSDMLFLESLYALGAEPHMDAVAAKPYGFSQPPNDRTVREDTLNFSRIVALREIMERHGDGTKPLWASAWGWNNLPDTWDGAPSIWGNVSEEQRTSFTLAALERAEREWAWLGGMILHTWQPNVPPNDPQWGFALVDPAGNPTWLWSALAARPQSVAATNGLYFPANDYAHYSGVWTFGSLGADIGWVQDSQLSFTYSGRDLSLLVREDNYVAYLYATVDGQPANALPRDAAGSAVLNLTSETRQPELSLVPVARGLGEGVHSLHLVADRGWDRWALAGFAVSSGDLAAPYNQQIAVALITSVISTLALATTLMRLEWSPVRERSAVLWRSLGNAGQLAVSVATSLALMVAMLLTWGEAVPSLFRREPVHFALAVLSAGLLYIQPHLVVMLVALLVLFVIIYHRLDLGLMLCIFYTPFFLFPVELYRFAFPMSELLVLVTGAAWFLRILANRGHRRRNNSNEATASVAYQFHALDFSVAALLVLGVLALFWSEQRGAAVTELRTLFLEPALFYLILRTIAKDQRAMLRLVDALLLAGLFVALIGLYQFARGEAVITAEEGARRLASVYGSPNNVGLFLGRCIPFLLAFMLVRVDTPRRIFAGFALLIMIAAALLSQSAGALLLGIPAAIVLVILLVFGRRGWFAVAGLAAVGAVGLLIASRSARFARILDFSEGTSFFRLRVWQSAYQMIVDHPLTGLGLDQFLYAYRGRYILPDAWQEPNLSHPHNFLLDFWLRLGFLGVICFGALQFFFWRGVFRLYHTFREENGIQLALVVGLAGSMINLLAHGLVDNSVFVSDLIYVFMLLLGLCANLQQLAHTEKT